MNDWRKVLRCRMSGTRAGRGWMVWAIWGMLGTAFTMEGTTGTEGGGGLGMAALLTAPFWLAFVLWPLFWIWRRVRDRQLWTEKVELLVHDPESSEPFGLEVLFGRDGVRVAVDEVNGVEGLSDALTGIPTRKPDEAAGIPFERTMPRTSPPGVWHGWRCILTARERWPNSHAGPTLCGMPTMRHAAERLIKARASQLREHGRRVAGCLAAPYRCLRL